ncbi:MAG: RNA polymerase factor sigma-54 [Defluviitaleaceae bacterium]|nr:RNA polymerase factor sigma-54 [Defluviitaleaceae bacterium]
MKLELQNRTTQMLTMTPQMELSIKILEMNCLELNEYIQSIALENPTIDIDAGPVQTHVEEQRERKLDRLAALAKSDRQNVLYYESSDNDFFNRIASPSFNTLEECIVEQVSLGCPKELRPAAVYAAGFLDEDGYFRVSAKEMSEYGAYPQTAIDQAISYIQGLEPAGVGARNLSECLLLQLDNNDHVARRIVSKYLDCLAKGKLRQLSKKLGVSEEEAIHAAERIRRLNPKPGSGFGSNNMTPYITPDIIVASLNNEFHVLQHTHSISAFSLNTPYIDSMRKTDEKDVIEYIDKKMKQAQWIKKCITSRAITLLKVAKEIVQRQQRFFSDGSQYMCVLRMSEIALALDLHESSVSRAVKNKYIECTHGIFPLKYFFVQGVESSNGSDVSSHEIKHEIKSLIDRENKSEPLSDQKIANVLERQGIKLSRRTVAKYREQLRIPTSYYRTAQN